MNDMHSIVHTLLNYIQQQSETFLIVLMRFQSMDAESTDWMQQS